LSTRQSLLTNH